MQTYKELKNQTAEYKNHNVKVYHINQQGLDIRYACLMVYVFVQFEL